MQQRQDFIQINFGRGYVIAGLQCSPRALVKEDYISTTCELSGSHTGVAPEEVFVSALPVGPVPLPLVTPYLFVVPPEASGIEWPLISLLCFQGSFEVGCLLHAGCRTHPAGLLLLH